MAPEMPEHQPDDGRIRQCFRTLAGLARALGVPRLSMGMSQDFMIAIEEGATDIRVGTRLFV
jgi:PLP dependent protein